MQTLAPDGKAVPTPNCASGSRWSLVDKWIETDSVMNTAVTK